MNGYQHKRVVACLNDGRLNEFELKFLQSIADKPVVKFPADDPHPLSEKQNKVLKGIAQRLKA